MAECACCGQTLPPDLPAGLVLSGYAMEIFDHVRKSGKHGVRSDVLFSRVYDSRQDGGPDTGIKIIAVYVNAINKKLRPLGQCVQGGRTGHGVYSIYRLVMLNA